MIIGFDPHDLSDALALHLGSAANGYIDVTTHGLASLDLKQAVKQLRMLGAGARTGKPGVHAFMSPSIHYNKKQWQRAWELFERETGLKDQPFVEVRHAKTGKGGRTADHIHRVYLRLRLDGRAIPMSHCAPRAEKLARICEFEHGERLIAGRYNRSVIDRLNAEGRSDVAQAMVASHLHTIERPEATSRTERAQTERLQDISADEVKRQAYVAWLGAENANALELRLLERGLHLCRGDNGKAMIVTARGSAYRLAASIASGAKIARAKGTVKAKDVHALVANLELCPIGEVRATLPAAPAVWGRAAVSGANRSVPNWLSASKLVPETVSNEVKWSRSNRNRAQIDEPPIINAKTRSVDASILIEKMKPQQREFSPEVLEKAQAFIDVLLGQNQPATNPTAEIEKTENEIAPKNEKQLQTPLISPSQHREMIEAFAAEKPPVVELFGNTHRDDYKAALAGVQKEFGSKIYWIDKTGGDPRKIFLRDSTVLRAETGRISSSSDTDLAIEMMISFAIEQEMQNPVLNGFNPQRREEIARLAARRGLILANKELKGVIADELAKITPSLGVTF